MDVLEGWSRTMEEGLRQFLGKKDKRCAMNHAEVCSVRYVEYCKDHNMNGKPIKETLERLSISMKFILIYV